MSVDSRIVTMKFDNTSFKTGVASTLDLLGKLKLAVAGMGSSKTSIGGVDTSKAVAGLAQIGSATEGISSRFSAMSVIAVTALATIAHSAVTTAGTMIKSFSFGPLVDGLSEYQLNLQSIQTIQANTDQPLTKINHSLEELNRYSDQTIYNFAEMAKNIGTFTAAGVDLKTATSSIKGIANMAALSGSTSQQASTAMYQLSQAISSGKVSLMDWNSVVNAGMGGEKLQNALAQTAVAMGTLNDNAIGTTGAMKTLAINGTSFRNSISALAPGEDGWLTSDVLVNTLASLDGRFSMMALTTEKTANGLLRYTKAEAKASVEAARLALEQKNGVKYTDAQFKSLMKLSDSSFLAATQVKTLSQVFDVAKETLASGWAATFQNIFGDFKEAKTTFTKLSGFINDGINAMALARNKVLSRWNEMGGRSAVINGIKNAFEALVSVLKPIGEAFRNVFPATTAKELYNASVAFRDFMKGLIAGEGTMQAIRRIFKAIFTVISEVLKVGMALIDYFIIDLISLLSGGAGGLLEMVGGFAKLITKTLKFLDIGDRLNAFLDAASAGRKAVFGPILDGLGALFTIVGKFLVSGAKVFFETLTTVFEAMGPSLDVVGGALSRFGDYLEGNMLDALGRFGEYMESLTPVMERAGEVIEDKLIWAFEKLGPVLVTIKDAIVDAFESFSGLGGLTSMFDIGSSADAAADGIDRVTASLGLSGESAVSGAKTGLAAFGEWLAGFGGFLGKAAGAILVGISWVGEALYSEIAGLFDGGSEYSSSIGEFVSSIFSKLGDAFSGISLGQVMLAINTALVAAVGGGFARALWHVGGFFKQLSDMGGNFNATLEAFRDTISDIGDAAKTSARADLIMKLGIALGILAVSLYILSKIDGKDLATGLAAVAAMLIMLGTATALLEKSMPDKNAIASTMQLAGISIVLVALATSMLLMAVALRIMAKLDGDEIAKGLATMGAVIAGIVAATFALNKSGGATSILQASIAIGILAFALLALAGAIKLYAHMDAQTLEDGAFRIAIILAALGVAFRAFPASGAVAGAAAMLIVSGALLIMSKALRDIAKLSAGDSWQAVLTLAGALTVLAIAMHAMKTAMPGAAALLVASAALAILIPQLIRLGEVDAKTLVIGLVALVGIFAALAIGGALLAPVVVVLVALGFAILLIGAGMALAGLGMTLFAAGLTVLASAGAAAMEVFISMINRFLEESGTMADNFREASVNWANAIRDSAPAWIEAGTAIILALLRSFQKTIPEIGKTFRILGAEILKTLRAMVPDMVVTGYRILMAFLTGLRDNMWRLVNIAVDCIVELARGLRANMDRIVGAATDTAIAFVTQLASEIGARALDFIEAGWDAGMDIAQGMANGMRSGIAKAIVGNAGFQLGTDAIIGAMKALDSHSPSREFEKIGGYTAEGLALGMDGGTNMVVSSSERMGNRALETLKTTMSGISDALAIDSNLNPTITPVLDLSKMQKDAANISSLLDPGVMTAPTSYSQASDISAIQLAASQAAVEEAGAAAEAGTTLMFEQNIHSPKAPNTVEVYRDTKSLIAIAKEALNL